LPTRVDAVADRPLVPESASDDAATELPEMDNPELVGGKASELENRATRM
jgi:hypothetical protein